MHLRSNGMVVGARTVKEDQFFFSVFTNCRNSGHVFEMLPRFRCLQLFCSVEKKSPPPPRGPGLQAKRTADNARGWFDDELTKRVVDWKEGLPTTIHPWAPADVSWDGSKRERAT